MKTCPNCRQKHPTMAPLCEECGFSFLDDKLPPLCDEGIRPPYPFFGSKRRIADDLWQLFGDVKKYIEPFLGSAAMLVWKPHAILSVVNDKNRYIANFWRAMQYAPDKVAELCDWPVNEADLHARHSWLEAQPFEESIANTPDGDELIQHIRCLEAGLHADPLWYDPVIAAWWVWGQCCWIGKGWCAGHDDKRPPELTVFKGIHWKSRQVEAKGGCGIHGRQISLGRDKGTPHAKSQRTTGDSRRDFLVRWFRGLQARLRDVIVCCGSWERVVTPCALGKKPCAILLDPPYKEYGLYYGRYHDEMISGRVRAWAVENGENPNLRIALCEYEGVFDMPVNWSCYRWDGVRGMSKTKKNAGRERVWCSPGIRPLDRLEKLIRVR